MFFLGTKLPKKISGSSAVVDGKEAFLIGDVYGSIFGQSVLKYTQAGQWIQETQKLVVGRAYVSAFVVNELALGKCFGKSF